MAFATKPALATRLIETALAAGVPCTWVAGDEVYGTDPKLRAAVAAAGIGFVLAVARTHRVETPLGRRRVADLAARPDLAWNRLPAGHGTKGPRTFDWALIDVGEAALTQAGQTPSGYSGGVDPAHPHR